MGYRPMMAELPLGLLPALVSCSAQGLWYPSVDVTASSPPPFLLCLSVREGPNDSSFFYFFAPFLLRVFFILKDFDLPGS